MHLKDVMQHVARLAFTVVVCGSIRGLFFVLVHIVHEIMSLITSVLASYSTYVYAVSNAYSLRKWCIILMTPGLRTARVTQAFRHVVELWQLGGN